MTNVIFPRDTKNDIDNTKVVKPEYLYAYTDPNATGTPLYAWTTTNEHSTPITIYTKTSTPDTSSVLYNSDGTELSISSILYRNEYNFSGISTATSEKLTLYVTASSTHSG